MKTPRDTHRSIVSAFIFLALAAAGLLWLVFQSVYETEKTNGNASSASNQVVKPNTVNDFASCKAAGNPIMESYPEQCTHDGKTYTNTAQTPQ